MQYKNMIKKILLLIVLVFLISCESKEIIKMDYQYPIVDSCGIYYSIVYFPEHGDSAYFFRTLSLPIRVVKDGRWVTFFYSIDGKPMWLYNGSFTYIQRLNQKLLDGIREKEEGNKKHGS